MIWLCWKSWRLKLQRGNYEFSGNMPRLAWICGKCGIYFTCGKAEKLLKEQRTELLEKAELFVLDMDMMGHFTWETGFWMERWT